VPARPRTSASADGGAGVRGDGVGRSRYVHAGNDPLDKSDSNGRESSMADDDETDEIGH